MAPGAPAFADFVGRCTRRAPAQRPSAAELLRHPYLVGASSRASVRAVPDSPAEALEAVRAARTHSPDFATGTVDAACTVRLAHQLDAPHALIRRELRRPPGSR